MAQNHFLQAKEADVVEGLLRAVCYNPVIVNYRGLLSNHVYVLQLEVVGFHIGV